MTHIEKFLGNILDIREGEGLRAVLMFAHIFLVISSLMIVKPVCNALFLSRFGAGRLPYVFILVAVFAAVLSKSYARLLGSIDLFRLIIRTLVGSAACLFIFWVLLSADYDEGWTLFVFYVWVAVFALVSSSQFWILGNSIFNPREARRLFSFIGAGAISGGIFGGYLTHFLAAWLGSIHLLWICIAFLMACVFIVQALRAKTEDETTLQKFRREKRISTELESPLRMVLHSRHLVLIAGIIGISVVVGRLVEYQFSAVASAEITDKNALAAFLGFWLSNLNIASFLIQIIATRRVVGGLGVGVSLFFLPVAVLAGALMLLVFPALWSAILIKMCDGSLKNSVNKAGMELLVLPVSAEVKNQSKTFVDVFVDSFATGIGGLLLLAVTDTLGLSVPHISVLILVLIVPWLYMVVLAQKEYLRSFRLKMMKTTLQAETTITPINSASILGCCIDALECPDPDAVVKVLRMVREVRHASLVPCFRRLITHELPEIRLETLKTVDVYPGNEFIPQARALAADPDPDIRVEALNYLLGHTGPGAVQSFREYLDHPDEAVRSSALLCAARESRKNIKLKQAFNIRGRIQDALDGIHRTSPPGKGRSARAAIARTIGAAGEPEFHPHLYIFLNDTSPKVVRAAIRAMGETRLREFIPALMPCLSESRYQKAAALALNDFGSDIAEVLSGYLNNPFVERAVRIKIPFILALVGTQKAADALAKNLQQADLALRYEVIRAMNHLRINFPELKFGDRHIVKGIFDEARDHLNMLTVLYKQRHAEPPEAPQDRICRAREQLIDALEKRLDYNLERIFRLLGLKYPPQEIFDVYQSLHSDTADLRVNAVEFLDNLLDPDLKKVVIPIIETTMITPMIDEALRQLGLKVPSERESMAMLLAGGDSTLHVRVLKFISQLGDPEYIPLAGSMLGSEDEKVREAARGVLKRMGVLSFKF